MARKRPSDDGDFTDEHIHYCFIRCNDRDSPSVTSDEEVDVVDDEDSSIRKLVRQNLDDGEWMDFVWNEIQLGRDIEPSRLPFNPAGDPGPVFPQSFSKNPTELDFFLLLMDEDIMNDLMVEINQYAVIQQPLASRLYTSIWKDIDLDELKRFFGMLDFYNVTRC